MATGARPGKNSGKRELFTESTSTALVFPNGGVIRLSVPVERGQLLFLTNQQTKREVVTQVTRRRDNPATGYYVELEFTEPTPDFWGTTFPETLAAAPANLPQPPAAALFQTAEAADDHATDSPAPTADEVAALMEEVEALREQLRSMQTQPAAPNTLAPTVAPPPPAPAPELAAHVSSLLAPAATPQAASSTPQPDPLSASAAVSPASAEVPPHHETNLAAPSNDDPLPKPTLDFQQAKALKQVSPTANPKPAPSDHLGTLRLALLAAVSLFAVVLAAWNMHWFPWHSSSPTVSNIALPPVRPAAKAASSPRPIAQPNPTTPPNASAASSTVSRASSQLGAAASAAQPGSANTPTSSNAPGVPPPSADPTPNPAPKHDSAPVVPVSKRSAVHSSTSAAPIPTSMPDSNAAIVPPQLIKSVRAVAPSDALRGFMTGNVTLDALIDKSGRVASMKVLSGPSSFHKAALDALKHYRYEPARQNGKPVAAHVIVTVPFWFEP